MKKLIAALILAAVTSAALANCPPWAPYNCKPDLTGKMRCGCGV